MVKFSLYELLIEESVLEGGVPRKCNSMKVSLLLQSNVLPPGICRLYVLHGSFDVYLNTSPGILVVEDAWTENTNQYESDFLLIVKYGLNQFLKLFKSELKCLKLHTVLSTFLLFIK